MKKYLNSLIIILKHAEHYIYSNEIRGLMKYPVTASSSLNSRTLRLSA